MRWSGWTSCESIAANIAAIMKNAPTSSEVHRRAGRNVLVIGNTEPCVSARPPRNLRQRLWPLRQVAAHELAYHLEKKERAELPPVNSQLRIQPDPPSECNARTKLH